MAEEKQDEEYGGCEGADSMYVRLVSSDGHEFIVKRDYALTSGTIKSMLSGPGQFAENETNEVMFREIPSALFETEEEVQKQIMPCTLQSAHDGLSSQSHVLAKVCQYFIYKVRYTNSSTEIPEFPITPEIALELLMAANFLDC